MVFVHSILFTTAGLAPHEQFEAFRAAHEAIVDVLPAVDSQTSFDISQRIWPLGRLVLTTTSFPRKGHPISWRHCHKAMLDHWYVVLPCSFDEGGSVRRKGKSLPLIHSLARPLTTQIEDDGALKLFVPRDLLAGSGLDNSLDAPLDSGLGELLADLMLSLDRRLSRVEAHELDHVTEAIRSFLEACARPSRDALAEAQAPISLALLERARRRIRHRLTEPNFTPLTLCKDLGVSRSRLYRLFEPFGGISAYVRRQRLLGARHALLDPLDFRPIARIAEQWTFHDVSVFSRAFRQEFGISPKAMREAGRVGLRGAGNLGSASSNRRSLAEVLRLLAA